MLRLRLVCSAGYYVRSLADALGERLGTGGHLAGLVRTRSGDFTLTEAVGLDRAGSQSPRGRGAGHPARGTAAVLAGPHTDAGRRVAGGPWRVYRAFAGGSPCDSPRDGRVRLLHPDGHLVAIAEPRTGGDSRGLVRHFLHPGVVLE